MESRALPARGIVQPTEALKWEKLGLWKEPEAELCDWNITCVGGWGGSWRGQHKGFGFCFPKQGEAFEEF